MKRRQDVWQIDENGEINSDRNANFLEKFRRDFKLAAIHWPFAVAVSLTEDRRLNAGTAVDTPHGRLEV